MSSVSLLLLLGQNHDHYGNVTAEVAYSGLSSRWTFPSLYYTFTQTMHDGATVQVRVCAPVLSFLLCKLLMYDCMPRRPMPCGSGRFCRNYHFLEHPLPVFAVFRLRVLRAQFVMIDTVILTGNSDLPHGKQLNGDELPGPANAELAQTQWQWVRFCVAPLLWYHVACANVASRPLFWGCELVWFSALGCGLLQIESTLAASTADYLIVAGHYPVWSVCEHGPTTNLVSQLKPLLEQYKVWRA